MRKGIEFLIHKKGKKAELNFHKDLYSLDSLKETFGKVSSFRPERNYWKVKMDNSSAKEILQHYNYLLYLTRKK